jgi:hypothetical protein
MQSFALIAVLLVSVTAGAARDDSDLITIATGVPQLFVDDFLIDHAENLRRTLNQPRKDNGGREPLLDVTAEFAPHTSTLEANGTIVFDPQLRKYVMFALGFSSERQSWDRVRLYRFTSDDGLQWSRGSDGKAEFVYPRTRDFFLDRESGTYATNIDLFCCCYDERNDQHPYQGWQWFANWGDEREGSYHMQSSDGIQWQRGRKIAGIHDWQIQQDGYELFGAGDVTTFSPDELSGRYLALVKFANHSAIGPENRQRARSFVFVDSLAEPIDPRQIQRVDLVPTATRQDGEFPHDEYYSSTAWRYGSLWLGTLKIWHRGGDHVWSAAGCAYLKLIYSRDGLHWKRVQFDNDAGVPEVFVPNGTEGGNDGHNDGGYITEFSNPPLRIGDELLLYYGASSWGKNHARGVRVTGGGIFRARLRPDGFVSVDGGILLTKTLVSKGDRLDLQVNSSGAVTISVLRQDGTLLGSTDVNGDSLHHIVRFDGVQLGKLSVQTGFRLRFSVGDGGKLYSFTVVSPGND